MDAASTTDGGFQALTTLCEKKCFLMFSLLHCLYNFVPVYGTSFPVRVFGADFWYVCHGHYIRMFCLGSDWTGVTLEEFMSCRHNLANNRQTRMLANLTLVGCYDHSAIPDSAERDRILLDSAVENLRQLAFFGLTERQADTQFLFERTFGIRFRRRFVQFNNTHAHKVDFTDDERAAVQRLNRLDLALYKFASRLFDERVRWARAVDKSDDGASWHVAGFDTVHEDNDSILDSDSYNGDDEPDEEDENEQWRLSLA